MDDGPSWPICDDCHRAYAPPIYYTVEDINPGHTCTGNIGPCCADGLVPDNERDPRMPWGLKRWVRGLPWVDRNGKRW